MLQLRKNGLPAYKRIQGTIVKLLKSGQLKPGDTVDSERELAKLHGVSLMTARHALAGLEREGVVVRRRGAGTFVAPPKIHFDKLMSYTEQMSSRGMPVSSKLLSLGVFDTEPEIAARLALPAASRLVKLERLRLGGNEPFAIETCYLPAAEFGGLTRSRLDRPSLFSLPDNTCGSEPCAAEPCYLPAAEFGGLTRSRLDRTSLFSILEHDYGLEIAHADEEVDATTVDSQSARLLGVAHGSAVLRIRQKIYSRKGKVALYVLGLYRSDRHTLFIRRFR